MQMGPYHYPVSRISGVWSLRIPNQKRDSSPSFHSRVRMTHHSWAFPADCLHSSDFHSFVGARFIEPAGRMNPTSTLKYCEIRQTFQHIARCTPHCYQYGGQRQTTLGPFINVTRLHVRLLSPPYRYGVRTISLAKRIGGFNSFFQLFGV